MQIIEIWGKIQEIISMLYNGEPILMIMMTGGLIAICNIVLSLIVYFFIPKEIIDEMQDGGMLRDKKKQASLRIINDCTLLMAKAVIPSLLGVVIILSKISFTKKWFYKQKEKRDNFQKHFKFLYFEDDITHPRVKVACVISSVVFIISTALIAIGGIGVLLEKIGLVPLETLNTFFR